MVIRAEKKYKAARRTNNRHQFRQVGVFDETFEQRPEESAEAHHVALWRRAFQTEGEASLDWGGSMYCEQCRVGSREVREISGMDHV